MKKIALETYRGVEFLYGTVRAWSGEDYMVETPAGILKTRLAAGCLLQPESGDRVLLTHSPEESYILAVLAKRNPTTGRMQLGGVRFSGREEGLTIEAADLELLISRRTRLETAALETMALEGRFFLKKAFFSAHRLLSRIQRFDLVTEVFNTFARKFVQRLKDCYAWVEGLEQRKIGRLRYLVKESLFLRARRSTLRAKEKVTIDGKKINLG